MMHHRRTSRRRAVLLLAPLAALLLAPASVRAQPEPLHLFAAATLKTALDAIAADWQRGGGAPVVLVYGPTPALAKQIENGAPADLFFSADAEWMDYLAQHKLIQAGTRVDLLSNRLVLIAGQDAPPVAPIGPGFPLATLVGAGPLAMCNPMHHPAGRYGRISLERLGLWASVADKVAIAEDVRVAVSMVGRGDAPLAVVFATDAADDPRVRIIGNFPDESHPPIVYPVAIVATSRQPDATRLLDYLKSPAATAVFERLGYLIPIR
jgi:molybdate transport system substrate-binding protein